MLGCCLRKALGNRVFKDNNTDVDGEGGEGGNGASRVLGLEDRLWIWCFNAKYPLLIFVFSRLFKLLFDQQCTCKRNKESRECESDFTSHRARCAIYILQKLIRYGEDYDIAWL